MIKNKKELLFYIKEDRLKASRPHRIILDEIGKYLYFLRKHEYFDYKSRYKFWFKIPNFYYRFKQHRLGVKLGFDIPINTMGPGIRIDHWGFVAVNGNAHVGKNCHIYGDVTIGIKNDTDMDAAVIGDNVTIGSGVRIIGHVKIASGVTIGANAVVVSNFLKENGTIAGVPAKYISK